MPTFCWEFVYFCIYSLKTRAIVVLLLTFVGFFIFIYMVNFSDGFKEKLNTQKIWGKSKEENKSKQRGFTACKLGMRKWTLTFLTAMAVSAASCVVQVGALRDTGRTSLPHRWRDAGRRAAWDLTKVTWQSESRDRKKVRKLRGPSSLRVIHREETLDPFQEWGGGWSAIVAPYQYFRSDSPTCDTQSRAVSTWKGQQHKGHLPVPFVSLSQRLPFVSPWCSSRNQDVAFSHLTPALKGSKIRQVKGTTLTGGQTRCTAGDRPTLGLRLCHHLEILNNFTFKKFMVENIHNIEFGVQ